MVGWLVEHRGEILIAAGFVLMALTILGEVVGWWNDLGVALALASLLLALVGTLDVKGGQLKRAFVAWVPPIAEAQGQLLERQQEMLEKQDQALTLHGRVLTVDERILERQDATIDALDRIHDTLEARLPGP